MARKCRKVTFSSKGPMLKPEGLLVDYSPFIIIKCYENCILSFLKSCTLIKSYICLGCLSGDLETEWWHQRMVKLLWRHPTNHSAWNNNNVCEHEDLFLFDIADNTKHYFICLLRNGPNTIMTQMVSTHDAMVRGSLDFPNLIKLQNIKQEFRFDLDIYGMVSTNEIQ